MDKIIEFLTDIKSLSAITGAFIMLVAPFFFGWLTRKVLEIRRQWALDKTKEHAAEDEVEVLEQGNAEEDQAKNDFESTP